MHLHTFQSITDHQSIIKNYHTNRSVDHMTTSNPEKFTQLALGTVQELVYLGDIISL